MRFLFLDHWTSHSTRGPVWLLGIVMFALSLGVTQAAEDATISLDPTTRKYFSDYCYVCHGEKTQKGERRLDQFSAPIREGSDHADLLEEALDAINRGDMPPQKKGVRQPPREATQKLVASVTRQLSVLNDAGSESTTALRRLNRFEYNNTLRDLLGLREDFFARTSDFPADARSHGFDNIGDSLVLSDYQLRRYVEVAQQAIRSASFFGAKKPEPKKWGFSAKDFNGVTSYERAPVTWRLIVGDRYMEIGHGQPSERHANYATRFARKGGVPAEGFYDIRVRASAANRLDHGYDHKEFDRYKSQRLKLALWIAPSYEFLSKNAAEQRQLVKVWDLPDGTPEVFTCRTWLPQGAIPFVSWTNGISSKGNIRLVAEKHHPEVIRATKTQRDAAELGDKDAKALVAKLDRNADNPLLSEVYHGPRVRIWGMEIEGPAFDVWPPSSHQLLFGKHTDAAKVDLGNLIQRFASRAFRRPVTESEVKHYADFAKSRIDQGNTRADAIHLTLAAVLTSPRFLYLDEGDETADSDLSAYEFASRLSYFLWSSMPDDELIRAATNGELESADGIRQQVKRMLLDSRSNAFIEHFTDSWLHINTLGSMPPDSKAFKTYYTDRLEQLFKLETRMFVADLVQNNESILNLLDSDYTFLNDALAKHYGVSGVAGEQMRKVALKQEHHRGGLLGQGSVLTLTANGIETSPVVRGVWVLENILGTPPPPPPPDVEPLEPDTRGTTTVREQLEKHRTVAACSDCHQKIDPAGFALEYYDPIGQYRTHYPARRDPPPVDGFGVLPTGESFDDERGLKRLLLQRKDRFTETLTEKLLTYATGREMTFRDQPEIKRIAAECETGGYRLRDLIELVATSTIAGSR